MAWTSARSLLLLVAGLLLAMMRPAVGARKEVAAVRVPDGAITVDGQFTEWPGIVGLEKYRLAADTEKNLYFTNTDRGVYGGPADCSMEAWLAADAQMIYLFANVHDQSLFNDTRPDNPFEGDDFEVFIDANPPEARFAPAKNDNVKQFIFVPRYINPQMPLGFIWQREQFPGLLMNSRLTSWGYQIEIGIPKALFPAWKAHPEGADSFGFDAQAVDADSPGQDGPHTSLKYACILLSSGVHFQNSVDYSNVKIDAQPATLAVMPAASQRLVDIDALLAQLPTVREADIPLLAQGMLDYMGDARIAQVIPLALESKSPVLRKTALFILAKRPEVPAPVDKLLAIATPPKDLTYGQVDGHDILCYTLVALAQRHQLPVDGWFGFYPRLAAPQVVLTYCWALGVNGDRHATPLLAKLLYDSNLRIRIKAAMALGELKDPAALPALDEMAANDPHHYARGEAQTAIKRIKGN